MTGPLLKKCFNCRIFLTDDAVNLSQCQKCQKNEAKYGKPTTCDYCKLNAAFHDKKCVWCSHAERKFGEPFSCVNCKLRCAFPRRECDRVEGAALLCRLCILQARQTNQKMVAGVPVPPEKERGEGSSGGDHHHKDRHHQSSSSSRHHHHKDRKEQRHHRDSRGHKRRHPDDSNNNSGNGASSSSSGGVSALLPNNENGGFPVLFGAERDQGESIVKQQKMEDEIRRLKTLVTEKEQQIFDKDRQISTLKAEQYNMEKKHRERVQQLQKEKEDSIRAMEHASKSKNAKKN